MNAHQKILTHTDYAAHRSRLRAELVTAKTANAKAELQAALGEIGDDDVETARAAVGTIEAELRGLDAARKESERREDQQQAVNNSAARRTAAKRARELDAKRVEEMEAIDRIIASLKTHVLAVAEIEQSITASLAPHFSALADNPVAAREQATSATELAGTTTCWVRCMLLASESGALGCSSPAQPVISMCSTE